MILIISDCDIGSKKWSVHYRRGESMKEELSKFAKQIIEYNLTTYAMIKVKDNDSRQYFQTRTVERLRIDPKTFLEGVE